MCLSLLLLQLSIIIFWFLGLCTYLSFYVTSMWVLICKSCVNIVSPRGFAVVGLVGTSFGFWVVLQLFAGYLGLTLVFVWNSALRENLISVFQEFLASIDKLFILAGWLGTRLSFHEVLSFSWHFLSCLVNRKATYVYHVYY